MDPKAPLTALRPLLFMWKVRLPLIAWPVMAGLRCLAGTEGRLSSLDSPPISFFAEAALVLAITGGTALLQLPFSVTWWFLLIAAFALETQLLIGVSTVLAMSLMLGWYGSVIRHPHAISTLWSCRFGNVAETAGLNATGVTTIPLRIWQAWDVVVHALPAVLMLLWHGPSFGIFEEARSGTVTPAAVLLAMPLTFVWLSCMSLARGRAPWQARLRDSNAVYCIHPALPDKCWQWVFGSHPALCALWLIFLTLPSAMAPYAAAFPLLWSWHLLARSHLREDLLLGRATFFLIAHALGAWGLCRLAVHPSAWRLGFEVVVMWMVGGFGITCGAHRLWAHRSYVAEMPFRVVLMLLNTWANQGTIYHWSRDHRAHHKWTDTPADPHDTTRGFFYAHIGWLLLPKTEELKAKGKEIPCGDLLADPVVAFQKWAEEKFLFMELVSFGLPALYGHAVYNSALLGFLVHGVLRWLVTLHATWCVNSVAHYFGDRPYDPQASPRESLFTSLMANGEGWHSYHHKFPWDYATSEYGAHRQWNPSKLFIDLAVLLGQARSPKRAKHLVTAAAARRESGGGEKRGID